MSVVLDKDCDELVRAFQGLRSPWDVSEMLDVRHRDFIYWLYRTPEERRYTTFYIPKKNGETRKIDAPTTNIKILQQKLNQVFRCVYNVKPSVHGFAIGKSVRSNAIAHSDKTWVFNVDLQEFFPSINFGRVRGLLMAKPYGLPQDVATVLAHLCCFQGSLPQGAPTSPIMSNMICARMDSQLQQLAKSNRCTYTRYADDITFSATSRGFPAEIAFVDGLKQLRAGTRLQEIIESNGFSINPNKVWLRGRNRRQAVTGITVNDFPNLPRKYTNQIRAMLYAWKKHGLSDAQREWAEKYKFRHRAPWLSVPTFEQVLKGKIEYLGMVKGPDSMTYLRFMDQLGRLNPKLTGGKGTPLRLLDLWYEQLEKGGMTPQARGYKFEVLISNLCADSGMPLTKGFTRNSSGEQIDEAFQLDNTWFMVECKWRKKKASPGDLDVLSSKMARSGHQTMGVFISVNGWSSKVIELQKQNPGKRIFLVDGEDVKAVLEERIPFVKLIREKYKALSLNSEPFISVEAILTGQE